MLDELALLIKLQDIDNQLMEIEAEKGDLPEQIRNLQTEINQYKSQIAETEENREKIKTLKMEETRIVEAAREQLKKSQSVIFSVKTTREYDAISTEIDKFKQKIAEGEQVQLEFMESEEDIQKSLVEMKQKLAIVEKDCDEREVEMKDRMNSTQEEELELNHEREKIVVRLKKPVYAHYDRIRPIRDGVGISHMANGACGYCFSRIPPQRQAEVRRADDIILCEVCGVILVE